MISLRFLSKFEHKTKLPLINFFFVPLKTNHTEPRTKCLSIYVQPNAFIHIKPNKKKKTIEKRQMLVNSSKIFSIFNHI